MLPPSRDRQALPGAYAELDALDEAATRNSNIAPGGDASEDEPQAGQAMSWVCMADEP